MRVLVLTNLFPNPYQPDRAPFNRQQFKLLAQLHSVRVIAPILWTDLRAARRAGQGPLPRGRRVVLDGLVVEHPTYWYPPKVLRGTYGRFYLWSVRRIFRSAVGEFRPDLVLASWAYPDGWAATRLAHRAGLPVVVKVHGSDLRLLEFFPRRASGTAIALRSADGVVAVSRDLGDCVERLGVARDCLSVIGNGVDRKTFSPGSRWAARDRLGLQPGVRHLLSIGNLTPVKGQDILIDACSRLSDRIGPWELHLIGAGPTRDRLAGLASRLGVTDRVRFHGGLPHDYLPDWYRAADAFILASRSEGVPNVLLEAAACGCPFVATDVGGVREVAALGVSRTVRPEAPDRLADAIVEILTHSPTAPPEGPRDWGSCAAALSTFLESVASRHARGRAPARPPICSAVTLDCQPAA